MVSDVTIEQLVDLIKHNDREAEQLFCRRYFKSTHSTIKALVREHSIAEDLTQETMLTVLLKLRNGKVNQPELLGGYVNRTAQYIVIGWYRRKSNQSHISIDEVPLYDFSRAAEDLIFDRERQKIVARMLASMRVARDREILIRHYIEGEDKSKLCKANNLSSLHFDRVIHRARSRCRSIAEKQSSHQMVALLEGM